MRGVVVYKVCVHTGFALLLAASCLLVSPTLHAASALEDDSPAAEIYAFWSQLDDRWNARDAVRFSELFAKDAIFRFVDRDASLEGRAAVREYFAERFPGFAAELRHLSHVNETREIIPTVHAVDGRVEILRMHDDNAEPSILRTYATYAVMMKNGEHWQILDLRVFRLPDDGDGQSD